MQFIKNSNSNTEKGFTIIEMIISIAIFMVIIVSAVSLFVSIIQQQLRILSEQELSNEISYAMEDMGRVLRFAKLSSLPIDSNCLPNGYNYSLTHYDATSEFYNGIKFLTNDASPVCEEFYYDSADGIFKETKNGGSPQTLLSSKFQIRYARFVINGDKTIQKSLVNEPLQPRITILLDVQLNTVGNNQEKIIQTTVSQRMLNISQ